jgi:hypothetical protein
LTKSLCEVIGVAVVILGIIPEFIPVLRLLTISAGLQLLR